MLRKLLALRMVILLCWALSPAWADASASYADLTRWGTGQLYGRTTVEPHGAPGEILETNSGAAALADVNASRGAGFSRAGTLGPVPAESPGPGVWLLIGGGLLAAGARCRHRPGKR